MATTESLEDAIKQLFPTAVFPNELDPSSELAQQGKTLGDLYTRLVRRMKSHPIRVLSTLAHHLWDVVGSNNVSVASYSDVISLSFLIVEARNAKETRQGLLFVPPTWATMVTQDPFMEAGAIIYTGSQAVDYYNGRFNFEARERIMARATSYEAEWIKWKGPRNPYQADVMRRFPNGFDARFAYPYKSVNSSKA